MYSQLESIVISYIKTLNNLINDTNSNIYDTRKIIINSIKELERLGCKIRYVDNALTVIEINENNHIRSKL